MKPDHTHTRAIDESEVPRSEEALERETIAGSGSAGFEDAGSKTVATSQRKIQANRANARRSTGPKTPAGKSRVSRNALKHGIFSRNLLTKDADGGEQPRDYAQIYNAIYQHYLPEGSLEELLVDKIATCYWRLLRVLRCETGQITRGLVAHRFQVKHPGAQIPDSPEMPALHNPEEDSIVDDLLLPSNGDLDRLLKYEDAISRQLDRAVAELERLQKRRNHMQRRFQKQSH